jgi:hypothetical protein
MQLDQAFETAIPRPLGALEKLFWLIDQHHSTHFTIAAEVCGPTRIDQWQDALDHVCQQSALIWSRIVPDERGVPSFRPVSRGSIPLHVVKDAECEWTAHVAAQADWPFDASRAPLLRATLLHGFDRSVIILSVHHSIADGRSLAFLMRDLLRVFAGEPVTLSRETASLDDLVAFWRKTAAMPQADGNSAASAVMPYRHLGGSIPRVAALRFTREITQSLRERARGERSTVHGALCAAVTAAAATLVPDWSEATLRVLSPIDIRRRMLNGSEHLGCCVSAVVLKDEDSANEFWSRARSFSDQLEPATSVEGILAGIDMLQKLMSPVATVQQAQEVLAQGFGAEILLTNLGTVEFADTYGPLTLRALWGPCVNTGFAKGQTVGAVTIGDQLHLLHTSYEPASGLLETAGSILSAALRESPRRAQELASADLAEGNRGAGRRSRDVD